MGSFVPSLVPVFSHHDRAEARISSVAAESFGEIEPEEYEANQGRPRARASLTPGRLGHLWGTPWACPMSPRDAKPPRQQGHQETGATGVELATSGVTGRESG
jgi:hypothetical protein